MSSELTIMPLATLSPTEFVGLRQCPLREVFRATGAPQLLPFAPAAALGIVIHRLLEDAGRGVFTSATGSVIDRRWNELIIEIESRMESRPLERHFVPLSRSMPDYEVRRLQARARATEISAAAQEAVIGTDRDGARGVGIITGCEVPVATPDGLIRGRIDAVVLDGGRPVIRDYKSGAIFDVAPGGIGSVKEQYKEQLRLYAALYASVTGAWPIRLEVVPLAGGSIPIDFDPPGCLQLLKNAYDVMVAVNEQIRATDSIGSVEGKLARPAPAVCRQCGYRPACNPYRLARQDHFDADWPVDVYGNVVKIEVLGNQRLLLQVDSGDRTIAIRGITAKGRHPELNFLGLGKSVSVFNLRQTGASTFMESPMTVIYRSGPAISAIQSSGVTSV